MNPSLKVAIVDGAPIFRVGVAHALRGWRPSVLIVEGGTAIDAMRIAASMDVEIMLVDPTLELDGTRLVASLVARNPTMKVVVLSDMERDEDIVRAIRQGARGYIDKRATARELRDAMEAVQGGEEYVWSPRRKAVSCRLVRTSSKCDGRNVLAGLTQREQEIAKQISVGATNREVAAAMGICVKTVKYHMTHIMEKLHVRNRVEAALAVGQLDHSQLPSIET